MRVSSYAVARPAPIDRNPATYVYFYGAAATAPSAQTQQLTYTVPAGKRATVQSAFAYLARVTAATANGRPNIIVTVNFGAGNQPFIYTGIRANTVGDKDTINITNGGTFVAGSIIRAYDQDDSTGGTTDRNTGFTILEFDN